jgi:hypothetical protein
MAEVAHSYNFLFTVSYKYNVAVTFPTSILKLYVVTRIRSLLSRHVPTR